MSSRRPPPKIIVEKHEGYRTIIQNGIWGGRRPGFFEYVIHTDEIMVGESLSTIPPDPSKVQIKRVLQCRIVLDAVQAKILCKWLTQHIEQYEKQFGKIFEPEAPKGKQPPPGMIT